MGFRALWWAVKLSPWFYQHSRYSLSFDRVDVSELNPPEGYDPYTGKVDGSSGPFLSEGGAVLYSGPIEVRKASMIWTRVGEDVAECSIHVLKLVDGLPSLDWGADDYGHVDDALTGLWDAVKGLYDVDTVLDRIVYHKDGTTTDRGGTIVKPNPAVQSTLGINDPGTAAEVQLPPQVAMSITEKTSVRRQWGRIYLPAPTTLALSTGHTIALGGGRMETTVPATLRTAAGVALDALNSHSLPWVVWSLVHNHVLTVDSVQADDLFDVIRRRRYDMPLVRETHTLGA